MERFGVKGIWLAGEYVMQFGFKVSWLGGVGVEGSGEGFEGIGKGLEGSGDGRGRQ